MSEPTCSAARREGYARRRPELTALHRTLSAHWPAFLERANEAGGLPKFVTAEMDVFLRCGLLEHGCALLVCERCGKSMRVAFSCKRRGFCPSCCGRRMNDAALHLTEQVFPEVPVRQWVCSLPFQLRYLLGYDRVLCAAVLRAVVVELSASYRRRAKRERARRCVTTGGETQVQLPCSRPSPRHRPRQSRPPKPSADTRVASRRSAARACPSAACAGYDQDGSAAPCRQSTGPTRSSPPPESNTLLNRPPSKLIR